MNTFSVIKRKLTRNFSRKIKWRSVPEDQLHTIDEQNFPKQPRSIPIPNEILREASSIGDLSSFYAIGEAWSHLVTHYLPENPKVLDLGCGCGKLARFLFNNPNLSYVGIDIYLPSIKWCQHAFSGENDRFRFEHYDGYSALYNPHGKVSPTEYRLPLDDESVDMIVCASLFTHLYENDAKHYLSEIFRVAKKGGQAIISIHVEPSNNQVFSGDESRIDIAPEYFKKLCELAQLKTAEEIGLVYGQSVFRLVKD